MSMIRFRDGMSFDTAGPLRITRRWDGYYVVGEGTLCPAEDAEAAKTLLRELREERAECTLARIAKESEE